jgi:hypothetical protein
MGLLYVPNMCSVEVVYSGYAKDFSRMSVSWSGESLLLLCGGASSRFDRGYDGGGAFADTSPRDTLSLKVNLVGPL